SGPSTGITAKPTQKRLEPPKRSGGILRGISMALAILVEHLQANPTVLLHNEPISFATDDDLPGKIQTAMDAFNAGTVVTKAGGALVWYPNKPNQTFEFFPEEQAIRARQFPHSVSLAGYHICASGRQYWYYGKVVGWVKGKRTCWEARLFHHDKKFVHD